MQRTISILLDTDRKQGSAFPRGEYISLYTLEKRMKGRMKLGAHQKAYFSQGEPKEGELICKKGKWYFNLILDLPDPPVQQIECLLGVDNDRRLRNE